MYYSLLYVIFSKNSFSLLSVFGVCRSSEKRVQRYRFSQYPPNISKIFLKKRHKFSKRLTKRAIDTLYIIQQEDKLYVFRQKDIKDIFFFFRQKDIKNISLKSEQQRNKFLKTEGLIRSA